MARYRGPKSKIARKFREPLFGPDKALEKKNYPPGVHGPNKRRMKKSEYAVQLAEKQKAKYDFQIGNLNLRIETLLKQTEEIEQVKNQEIERLTEAAKKRPNDYSAWWATGGFAAGVLTTLAIVLAL